MIDIKVYNQGDNSYHQALDNIIQLCIEEDHQLVPLISAGASYESGVPLISHVVNYLAMKKGYFRHQLYACLTTASPMKWFKDWVTKDQRELENSGYLVDQPIYQSWHSYELLKAYGWRRPQVLREDIWHWISSMQIGDEDTSLETHRDTLQQLEACLTNIKDEYLTSCLLSLAKKQLHPHNPIRSPENLVSDEIRNNLKQVLSPSVHNQTHPHDYRPNGALWSRLSQDLTRQDPDLQDDLFRLLVDGHRPATTHLYLAQFARVFRTRLYLTTNFDTFLEQALDAKGIRYDPFHVPIDGQLPNPKLLNKRVALIKLHGSGHSLLTGERLDMPLDAESRRRLKSYINSQSLILVLGYSGTDQRILDFLRESLRLGAKIHWVTFDHTRLQNRRAQDTDDSETNHRQSQWISQVGKVLPFLVEGISLYDSAKSAELHITTAKDPGAFCRALFRRYKAMHPTAPFHIPFSQARPIRCLPSIHNKVGKNEDSDYQPKPNQQLYPKGETAINRQGREVVNTLIDRLNETSHTLPQARSIPEELEQLNQQLRKEHFLRLHPSTDGGTSYSLDALISKNGETHIPIYVDLQDVYDLESLMSDVVRKLKVFDPYLPAEVVALGQTAQDLDVTRRLNRLKLALKRGRYIIAWERIDEFGRGPTQHHPQGAALDTKMRKATRPTGIPRITRLKALATLIETIVGELSANPEAYFGSYFIFGWQTTGGWQNDCWERIRQDSQEPAVPSFVPWRPPVSSGYASSLKTHCQLDADSRKVVLDHDSKGKSTNPQEMPPELYDLLELHPELQICVEDAISKRGISATVNSTTSEITPSTNAADVAANNEAQPYPLREVLLEFFICLVVCRRQRSAALLDYILGERLFESDHRMRLKLIDALTQAQYLVLLEGLDYAVDVDWRNKLYRWLEQHPGGLSFAHSMLSHYYRDRIAAGEGDVEAVREELFHRISYIYYAKESSSTNRAAIEYIQELQPYIRRHAPLLRQRASHSELRRWIEATATLLNSFDSKVKGGALDALMYLNAQIMRDQCLAWPELDSASAVGRLLGRNGHSHAQSMDTWLAITIAERTLQYRCQRYSENRWSLSKHFDVNNKSTWRYHDALSEALKNAPFVKGQELSQEMLGSLNVAIALLETDYLLFHHDDWQNPAIAKQSGRGIDQQNTSRVIAGFVIRIATNGLLELEKTRERYGTRRAQLLTSRARARYITAKYLPRLQAEQEFDLAFADLILARDRLGNPTMRTREAYILTTLRYAECLKEFAAFEVAIRQEPSEPPDIALNHIGVASTRFENAKSELEAAEHLLDAQGHVVDWWLCFFKLKIQLAAEQLSVLGRSEEIYRGQATGQFSRSFRTKLIKRQLRADSITKSALRSVFRYLDIILPPPSPGTESLPEEVRHWRRVRDCKDAYSALEKGWKKCYSAQRTTLNKISSHSPAHSGGAATPAQETRCWEALLTFVGIPEDHYNLLKPLEIHP